MFYFRHISDREQVFDCLLVQLLHLQIHHRHTLKLSSNLILPVSLFAFDNRTLTLVLAKANDTSWQSILLETDWRNFGLVTPSVRVRSKDILRMVHGVNNWIENRAI